MEKNGPIRCPFLIHRTYEYLILHQKRYLADVIKVKDTYDQG